MKKLDTLTKTIIDPVCGMKVDPCSTDLATDIDGMKYYFCAEGCLKVFEENPGKYLDPKKTKKKGWWNRYLSKLNKATDGKPIKCH